MAQRVEVPLDPPTRSVVCGGGKDIISCYCIRLCLGLLQCVWTIKVWQARFMVGGAMVGVSLFRSLALCREQFPYKNLTHG
jgi:hypothetical protein